MKEFKYTQEQLSKILQFLAQVETKGDISVTSLAMVFQELKNGIEIVKQDEGMVDE